MPKAPRISIADVSTPAARLAAVSGVPNHRDFAPAETHRRSLPARKIGA